MNWLTKWWKKRQRRIDVQILWPAIKDNSPSLDLARAAFLAHALYDPAWESLTDAEVFQYIAKLK